jgi:hypothetical protein
MAVRPEVAWQWRSLRLALAVAAAWLLLSIFGGKGLSYRQAETDVSSLQSQVEGQETELTELRAQAARNERQLQMERAAAADLAKQLKALTFENAKLKEDLAFFQSLMSTPAAREGAINVSRFRLLPEPVAGEYRYQVLLVQSGRRMTEFHGKLQFIIDAQQNGRKLAIVVPAETERDAREYQLNFKFFQRVEGTLRLSPGTVLNSVQLRVYENGARAPKLTQQLNLP